MACVDEQESPGQTQTHKGSLQRVEARTGSQGETERNCLSHQGSGQESESPDTIKPGQGIKGIKSRATIKDCKLLKTAIVMCPKV